MDSTITVTDLHVLQLLLSIQHTLWVGVTFVVKDMGNSDKYLAIS